MANFGVSYGSGRRQPVRFGTTDSRSSNGGLSQSMQPLSSVRPNGSGFQAINQPAPLDALSRVLQGGQDTFSKIVPAPFNPPDSQTYAPKVSTAPSSTYQGTDLSADPILNQIKDLGRRGVNDAATAGLAGAKNDLINFGSIQVPQTLKDLFGAQTPSNDPLLGDLPSNPVLAALNDSGTAQAAAGNPFSVSHQLSQAHDTNQHAIDQTANLANLYYSSTHANQLGDENNAYLGSQNSALQALAQALSGENSGLLGALNGAHDQYVNELPNAYQRAIAAGGSGDSGTAPPPPPGDGTTPPPPAPGASGFSFTPGTNPLNPLLAALAGQHPAARQSLLNRYAG